LRFLTSKPASVVSSPRTYTSFAAPSRLASNQIFALHSQRRWATTGTENDREAPISKLQATGPEEVENAIHEENTQAAPAIAETANLTEATEETIPAAETNEKVVGDGSLLRNLSSAAASATGAGAQQDGEGFQKKSTLYVGNLFFDVTEADLTKEFAQFGTVTRCKMIRDGRGLSKGFAYIDFTATEAAEEAIKHMNMQLYEGRRMTVQYAARSSNAFEQTSDSRGPKQLNPPSKTLFIGNMSFEMTDRDLSNLFRGIRNVVDVRVAIDRRTGQPRGFAHADFVDVKSAMEAMKLLQDKETYGRRLRIDYSYSSNTSPRNMPPAEPAADN
jgi:RNA recognition motif-containing protein